MFGYILQDWTTIRVQSSSQTVTQNETQWLGFNSFQDMVFWVDTREATIPSGGTIVLSLETAPSKDEVLFQQMAPINLVQGSYSPGLYIPSGNLPKVILSQGPSVPLATWVRWRAWLSGATALWDLTFRVLLTANRVWR